MENITLARPYARAIFELAVEQHKLAFWRDTVRFVATLVADPAMQKVLSNPQVSVVDQERLLGSVAGDYINEWGKRLISVLAQSRRLLLLPAILRLYEQAAEQQEQTITVQVRSARPMESTYQQRLQHALQQRFHCGIALQCVTDGSLLGGAVVRIGDNVIDGSVRGRSTKLAEFLRVG